MPASRGRLRKNTQPEGTRAERVDAAQARRMRPSPSWYAPVMVTLMLIGLVWLVVFYLSSALYPVPNIGNWNLAIGFAFIIVGFLMTTNWR